MAILVGLVINSRTRATRLQLGGPPVAYCVNKKGDTQIARGGQLIPGDSGAVLADDEIRLAAGASITLMTAGGFAVLNGPQSFASGTEAAQAVGLLATNALRAELQTVLFAATDQLPSSGLVVTRGQQSIPVYSPMGSTAMLTPVLLWKAQPEKTYDLQITDEFDRTQPPWRVAAVTPPLDFSRVEAWRGRPLAKDGLYRLRITETGRPLTVSEYTFRTLNEPSTAEPDDKLLNAVRVLAYSPARLGDALAGLLTLPKERAQDELVLRLKLFAFGKLGYADDYETAASELKRLGSRK